MENCVDVTNSVVPFQTISLTILPSMRSILSNVGLSKKAVIAEVINELRGGSLTTMLIRNAIFVVVLYGIWILSSKTQGFVTPPQQEFVSDFTSVNNFESDVLGITPVDPDWQI